MSIWQDCVKRGCCGARIFPAGHRRGFAFRFPKPKIMAKWLNVPYPRDIIECGFIGGKTDELGEFEVIMFMGGSTEDGGPETYAVLIEVEDKRGISRIGILDEGIIAR